MPRLLAPAFATISLGVLIAACGNGDGGPRRTIVITQTDDSCTPNPIAVTAGERITFEVKNAGSKDKEIEGIEGTAIGEVLVPSGRTRSIDFTAPGSPGTRKIKCYVPGGSSTIIEVSVTGTAAGGGGAAPEKKSRRTDRNATDTVKVGLVEYTVTADKASVAPGAVKFAATNTSRSEVHELAVLRTKADGSYENTGEVEDIEPGKSGEVTLDLPAGKYVLACLIAPGQAGSTKDHFKEGMRLDFEVK